MPYLAWTFVQHKTHGNIKMFVQNKTHGNTQSHTHYTHAHESETRDVENAALPPSPSDNNSAA
jgi:hypothetical protein